MWQVICPFGSVSFLLLQLSVFMFWLFAAMFYQISCLVRKSKSVQKILLQPGLWIIKLNAWRCWFHVGFMQTCVCVCVCFSAGLSTWSANSLKEQRLQNIFSCCVRTNWSLCLNDSCEHQPLSQPALIIGTALINIIMVNQLQDISWTVCTEYTRAVSICFLHLSKMFKSS